MFEFTCPTCGKRVQGDDSIIGKQVLCPGCNMLTVPGAVPVTAIATPEHAAQASVATPKASDTAFSEGLPPLPPAPLPPHELAPHIVRHWFAYVVIAVMALTLLGLAIPFVMKLRQDAARAQSTNNLKKISLAMASFHDVNKCLPFNGTKPAKAGDATSGSWAFQILPFVDQTPLFMQPDTTTAVPTYMCPGRGRPAVSHKGAWTDYFLNPWLNDPNGVVNAPDVKRTMVGVTDGVSNTIFVGHGTIDPDRYATNLAFAQSTDIFKGGDPALARRSTTNQHDTAGNDEPNWGGPFPQGALMGMGDGTVRCFPFNCTGGNITNGAGVGRGCWPRDGAIEPLDAFLTPTGGEWCEGPD